MWGRVVTKFILFLYHLFESRRKLLFVGTTVWILIALFFALHLNLSENISALTENFSDEQQSALKSLHIEDKLSLIITDKNPGDNSFEKMTTVATSVATELQTLKPLYLKDILFTIDAETMQTMYNFVAQHPYLYLDKNDYRTLKKQTTTDAIRTTLEQKYRQLLSPTGFVIKRSLFNDPLDITPLAMQKFSPLQNIGNIHLKDGFFFSQDDKNLVIFLTLSHTSNETDKTREMLDIIEAKATPEGKFIPESIYRAWKDWDFGQKKIPSPWITFLVYRIFYRLGRVVVLSKS